MYIYIYIYIYIHIYIYTYIHIYMRLHVSDTEGLHGDRCLSPNSIQGGMHAGSRAADPDTQHLRRSCDGTNQGGEPRISKDATTRPST